VCGALIDLGIALIGLNRAADAEPALREALALRQQHLPAGAPLTAGAASALGDCLIALGRFTEAEQYLLEADTVLQSNPQSPARRRRETIERLVRLYEQWNKPNAAAQWREQLGAYKD
jgi:serine/threonine-protein kinase